MSLEYGDGGGVLSEEGLVDCGDVGQEIFVQIVGGRMSYGGYLLEGQVMDWRENRCLVLWKQSVERVCRACGHYQHKMYLVLHS